MEYLKNEKQYALKNHMAKILILLVIFGAIAGLAIRVPSKSKVPTCTRASCNDNNACTTDTCVKGVCQHTPVSCDDGNPNTRDTCRPIAGCIHIPQWQPPFARQ